MSLQDTLGNMEWLRANEDAVKKLLPENWTHIENLNGMKLGFGLKLVGIDWRSEDQFGKVMLFLEKIGFMQRQNGYQVRANPSRVIPSAT